MSEGESDFDDVKWEKEMRNRVIDYLGRGNVDQHGEVGIDPAYSIPGVISIWAIESKEHPGWVGFWCFAGDIPTDVVERNWGEKEDDPRKALSRLLEQWERWIPFLSRGDNPPGISLGSTDEMRISMSSMLASRIHSLREIQGNDEYWEY